nr:MAG TPA: hypothetical protein [Caudoviricetes sp.]
MLALLAGSCLPLQVGGVVVCRSVREHHALTTKASACNHAGA